MSSKSQALSEEPGSPRRESAVFDRRAYDKATEESSPAAVSNTNGDKDKTMFCARNDNANHMSMHDRTMMMTSRVDALVSAAHRLGSGTMGSMPGEDELQHTVKHIKVEDGSGAKPRSSLGPCKVCGDEATGMYFGALVCVPCKVSHILTLFMEMQSQSTLIFLTPPCINE